MTKAEEVLCALRQLQSGDAVLFNAPGGPLSGTLVGFFGGGLYVVVRRRDKHFERPASQVWLDEA